MSRRLIYLALLIVSPVLFYLIHSRLSSGQATITLDPQTTYQTIVGWEAVAQAGQVDCQGFDAYKDALFDAAINDLGINRLRVEIRAKGKESLEFNLSGLDPDIENVVLPMKKLAEARGEGLFVNVNFVGPSGFTSQPDMSAYAEQVLLTYNHLHDRFGFYPDAWEIALEPDVVSPGWRAPQIDAAVIQTNELLIANGISDPYFIAPSSACGPVTALNAFNGMLKNNQGELPTGLGEFSYHRYCQASDEQLQSIGAIRTTYGINTSMLEHGGADYRELHADLKLAEVSAWQQFALAYCTSDNGFQYYPVDGDHFSLGERTKYLRQYFRYIRSGAVRIEAGTDAGDFDPLAFINTDGSYVVVIKAAKGGEIDINGLPQGSYDIAYTTDQQYDVHLPEMIIETGQSLMAAIPARGVITIVSQSPKSPERL